MNVRTYPHESTSLLLYSFTAEGIPEMHELTL